MSWRKYAIKEVDDWALSLSYNESTLFSDETLLEAVRKLVILQLEAFALLFPEPPAEATVMLAGKSRVRLLTYYIIVTQAPLN